MAEEQAPTMTAESGETPGAPAETPPSPPAEPTAPSGSQVEAEPTQQQPAQQAEPDYDSLARTHPRLREIIQREADRLAQKRLAKQQRDWELEELNEASEDAPAALKYAQKRKATLAEEASAEVGDGALLAELQDAWRDRDWAADYNEVVQKKGKEAAGMFGQPKEFMRWMDHQIADLRIDRKVQERLEKILPTVASARATELTNAALKNVPLPPTGSAAPALSDEAFIEAYNAGRSDDHARARRILDSL